MSEEQNELSRRRLLVLGAAATVLPACGGTSSTLPPEEAQDGGSSSSGADSSSSGSTRSGSGGSGSGGSSGGAASGSGSSSGGSASSGGMTCPTGSSTYEASFGANPALQTVGSGATVNPPNYQDGYGNDSIYVVQQSAGSFIAYSLSCTHQGCVVRKSGSGWRCPCHGATFSGTGEHTSGPGNGNLQSYPVCANAAGVIVSLP
jgi:Rieske Fe-S protein